MGDNGSLSFSFEIPSSVAPGTQDLRVHTTSGNANTIFTVGSGELQLSTINVLPNQRISISGSGFTKSANQESAYIGDWRGKANSCPEGNYGAVTLGGQPISWERINDGDGIEITSGGTWSAPIDLPVNASTTSAGTRELKIIDCRGGLATVDLTFATREVTMTPAEGGVGTEVVISGKNYPVSNDDGSDIEVFVEYDAGVDRDYDDIEPDALGSFTVILEVPEDANIPSNNTVSVWFYDDDYAPVLDTFTHRVIAAPVGTCIAPLGPLTAPVTKTGGWADDCDSEGRPGSYARYYSFTLDSETQVEINLTSNVDTYLLLRQGEGRDGLVAVENDNVGSRNFNSSINEMLDAGTYTVEATTYFARQTGNFTLSVRPLQETENLGTLTKSIDRSNSLWTSDHMSTQQEGSYARSYTFTMTAATHVVINLTSPEDPYLFVLDSGGMVAAENDNVTTRNLNSRIDTTLDAGEYTIEATTYFAARTGTFHLSIGYFGTQ